MDTSSPLVRTAAVEHPNPRSVLQIHSKYAVRRHGLYMLRRWVVLLVADAVILGILHMAGWASETPAVHAIMAMLVGLAVTGNYGPADGRRNAGQIVRGVALAGALISWTLLWSQGLRILPQVGLLVLNAAAAVYVGRRIIDEAVVLIRQRSRSYLRALLVGSAEQCMRTATSPAFSHRSAYTVAGFVVPRGKGRIASPAGFTDELDRLIRQNQADTVVICGDVAEDQLDGIADLCRISGCELLTVPTPFRSAKLRPVMISHRGEPLIALTAPARRAWQLAVKRALDILFSSLGLVMTAPVLVMIAVAVKLSSPGPVLYRQERVGHGGRTFTIYKFRSMVKDAEERLEELRLHSLYADRRLFKMDRDPRITPLGSILRRTSLDELPQLWNVLRGDMSLVGTRPPVPSEVSLYEEVHYCRFDVKPGITGPWQVAGRNQVTSFDAVVELEREYIDNWSLTKDFSILLRTFPVVLTMRGAH